MILAALSFSICICILVVRIEKLRARVEKLEEREEE